MKFAGRVKNIENLSNNNDRYLCKFNLEIDEDRYTRCWADGFIAWIILKEKNNGDIVIVEGDIEEGYELQIKKFGKSEKIVDKC